MLEIRFSKQARKFTKSGVPAKHLRQIALRLQSLAANPNSLPTEELKGFAPYRRATSGEYRIIYRLEDNIFHVTLIGKRNDDEVYKLVSRFLK